MKAQKVKISTVKTNPNNPRLIKDDKFKKLVSSIKEFPEMLEIRPIVVDKDNIVLGGNMRLRACQEAGLKEVYIVKADKLTEKQQREFTIKDNLSFGEWDWDEIANNFETTELNDWGLDVWQPEEDIDYSILDDEDLAAELDDMTSNVKRAIQIEFEAEHYEEAYQLVRFWREQDAYVGKMILDFLKAEKNKL